jgi:nicotinate-nucleotide adenylyltransferase
MHDKICIMGGTFNPIHTGHLQLAIQAHGQFNLKKILIMPNSTPVYKDSTDILPAEHRCNMILEAIKDYPFMELSTMEIDRGGTTYTSDTLRQLLREDASLEIYFIIGADSLFDLPKWHESEYVCTHCHLLAANRGERDNAELLLQREYLKEHYNAQIDFLKTANLPYSSTNIRSLIAASQSITGMVPQGVEEYIRKNHLYTSRIMI